MEFSFKQTVVKIFSPLFKHPIWMIGISFLITGILYGLTDIVFAGLIRQNTLDISVLTTELLYEAGPYVSARQEQVGFMEDYIDHIEQKNYTFLLKVLYPEYSLDKALAKAKKELDEVAVNDELTEEEKEEISQKAIRKAALASHQIYLVGKKYPRSPKPWIKFEDVPKETLEDLDGKLDAFHKLTGNLYAGTLPTAVDVVRKTCIDSRIIYHLSFRCRSSYSNEEKTERFIEDLIIARDFARKCAQNRDFESKWDLFKDRDRNMDLRARALKPLLAGNMDGVCAVLNAAKAKIPEILAMTK